MTLALRRDLPVISSVHTRFETYPRYYGMAFLEPVLFALMRRFYRRCDAIFAPSDSMAQLLRDQRMNYDVGIWTRGIDREIFNPQRRDLAWRRSLGIADDEPVVGFTGRLVMEKGLDVFSDTVERLTKKQVRHKVLVVGDGPARGWFEKRLPDAVFAGFQAGPDLGRAVASMDMLFNPSVTETFGNVTLEAMATGLPVVAARATGSESLVDDGVTGRLIRPGAIHLFSEALGRYCTDAEARAAAGEAGFAASQRYGWDEVNQALVDAYVRVIRQHDGGRQKPSPLPEFYLSRSIFCAASSRMPAISCSRASSMSSRVARCQSAESRLPTERRIGAPPALRWSLPRWSRRSNRLATSSAFSARCASPSAVIEKALRAPSAFTSSIRPMSCSMVSVG